MPIPAVSDELWQLVQPLLPMAVSPTASNAHDVTQLLPLLDAIPAVAGKRGRPGATPDAAGDRGYDQAQSGRRSSAAAQGLRQV
jgi:hypothetical protein